MVMLHYPLSESALLPLFQANLPFPNFAQQYSLVLPNLRLVYIVLFEVRLLKVEKDFLGLGPIDVLCN